jgi:hypothetical protein
VSVLVRAAIVAKLQAVPGVGVVHPYERYVEKPGKFLELFTVDGRVAGWIVRRVAEREMADSSAFNRVETDWELRGYASLLDAEQSELSFDSTVDRVRDAFRSDQSLGGVVTGLSASAAVGLQLADSGPVMFAGVLCHSARLTLTTISRKPV